MKRYHEMASCYCRLSAEIKKIANRQKINPATNGRESPPYLIPHSERRSAPQLRHLNCCESWPMAALLVVDDEPLLLNVYTRILSKARLRIDAIARKGPR